MLKPPGCLLNQPELETLCRLFHYQMRSAAELVCHLCFNQIEVVWYYSLNNLHSWISCRYKSRWTEPDLQCKTEYLVSFQWFSNGNRFAGAPFIYAASQQRTLINTVCRLLLSSGGFARIDLLSAAALTCVDVPHLKALPRDLTPLAEYYPRPGPTNILQCVHGPPLRRRRK